jgi:hypothetical protein
VANVPGAQVDIFPQVWSDVAVPAPVMYSPALQGVYAVQVPSLEYFPSEQVAADGSVVGGVVQSTFQLLSSGSCK